MAPRNNRSISAQTIREAITEHGPEKAARLLGINPRGLHRRRRIIERRENASIVAPHEDQAADRFQYEQHAGRVARTVKNGVVIIGGDNHYEPGHIPVMHRALVALCKELKPVGVILNGDICDFSRLGKYPAIGWEERPAVVDEIEAAKDRLSQIEKATFRAWKDWPLGNHDARFNTALANDPKGKEYARIHGTSLKDHFPLWTPCWAVWINAGTPGFTISQHRSRGGEHGSYRNAKEMGCHYVTGHTHDSYVRPYTNAIGTIYGVNHGCIADVDQKIFINYTEARPLNWRSAFAVLTYVNGLLLPPELVSKWDNDHVVFRGQITRV
jgi:hypothetical protein